VSFDLNAAGTSAVETLASAVTTAGVAGVSYPATGVKATVPVSPVNAVLVNESLLEKLDPLENDDDVKHGSNDAGAKVAAGAKEAPPSPTDPILSLITFKSPSFEWSGAPLFKQQLCQALAVLLEDCLIEPGYRMGVLISRESYRDSCCLVLVEHKGGTGRKQNFTVSNIRLPGFRTSCLFALLYVIFETLQFCGMAMGGFPLRPRAAKMRA